MNVIQHLFNLCSGIQRFRLAILIKNNVCAAARSIDLIAVGILAHRDTVRVVAEVTAKVIITVERIEVFELRAASSNCDCTLCLVVNIQDIILALPCSSSRERATFNRDCTATCINGGIALSLIIRAYRIDAVHNCNISPSQCADSYITTAAAAIDAANSFCTGIRF